MQAADKPGRIEAGGDMTDSVRWGDLPASVRQAVEKHTGPVRETAPGGEGLSTSLRLILRTARGSVFAKGTGPGDDGSRVWRLETGAALAPYVAVIAPPLLWQVKQADWNITGYEYIAGRPWADQKPGSPDIPAMLDVLTALASIPAPEVLTVTAADCWGQYASDPDLLDGDMLVHRDPNPTNFVVDGNRAWMVDWGWAVRGPAWLTAAMLVLSLMEAGWEPGAAEQAVASVPGWNTAPPGAVQVFADAHVRMWDEAVAAAPGWPRDFRASVARKWASHRAGLTGNRM
jgi:hypothetical protein